jgi:hypothetical protein
MKERELLIRSVVNLMLAVNVGLFPAQRAISDIFQRARVAPVLLRGVAKVGREVGASIEFHGAPRRLPLARLPPPLLVTPEQRRPTPLHHVRTP